jgi:hypothetical protein
MEPVSSTIANDVESEPQILGRRPETIVFKWDFLNGGPPRPIARGRHPYGLYKSRVVDGAPCTLQVRRIEIIIRAYGPVSERIRKVSIEATGPPLTTAGVPDPRYLAQNRWPWAEDDDFFGRVLEEFRDRYPEYANLPALDPAWEPKAGDEPR